MVFESFCVLCHCIVRHRPGCQHSAWCQGCRQEQSRSWFGSLWGGSRVSRPSQPLHVAVDLVFGVTTVHSQVTSPSQYHVYCSKGFLRQQHLGTHLEGEGVRDGHRLAKSGNHNSQEGICFCYDWMTRSAFGPSPFPGAHLLA